MDTVATWHTRYSPEELEAQYNLSRAQPEHAAAVMARWSTRSDAARAQMNVTRDIRYGEGPRQRLDLYPCGKPGAPLMVYLHGGYWQRGDKALYAFLAQSFVRAGVDVVTVGYDLCPDITVTRIVEQAREAMAYLWREAHTFGMNRDRIIVTGHSAGGHLTEMMTGTDWPGYAPDLPRDLVKAGVPISPLSLLEPVRRTAGLNAVLKMDAEEAAAQSPVLNHPPRTNAPQIVIVGGAETPEFQRQAKIYADAFDTDSRRIALHTVPEADHFGVIDALADPVSETFRAVRTLMEAT